MTQCKMCYTSFGKFRLHCPTCGCAKLPNGAHINVNSMRVIVRKNFRSVSKYNAKVSAR